LKERTERNKGKIMISPNISRRRSQNNNNDKNNVTRRPSNLYERVILVQGQC
jgi:hypothetical protein